MGWGVLIAVGVLLVLALISRGRPASNADAQVLGAFEEGRQTGYRAGLARARLLAEVECPPGHGKLCGCPPCKLAAKIRIEIKGLG